MKKLCFFFLLLYGKAYAKNIELRSPSGNINLEIHTEPTIQFAAYFEGKLIIQSVAVGLHILNAPDKNLVFKNYSFKKINEQIISPVPEKRRVIPDIYNEVTIQFKQPLTLQIRCYDDGIAYRWLSSLTDSITVLNEIANITFTQNHSVYYPLMHKRNDADIFHTSFEELYQHIPLDSISSSSMAYSPVLVKPEQGPAIAITESDLEDYPGMFISGNNDHSLHGVFAGFPLEEKIAGGEFKQAIVTRRADYIARTNGSRTFPWRVLMIAKDDAALPSNDLVYRLASPSRLKNASWIHPGKCTDEWIIGINLFNVDFKSGVNTASYKYYIDFAKRFGFDRIMMDAGWSDNNDLFKINPNINMDTIAAYAKSKGIKLSMWTLALTLNKQLDSALKQFQKWSVDFIMTDFMDRDDQKMVNFYYRVAAACAAHNIMIMYHGAFPPKGFNRTYPNAVTREAVLGSEYSIWSDKPSPEHDVTLPFTRMLSGPMDYEPGILDNATKAQFRSVAEKVMSQGTRCHQLAMFVVYDSPIQVFSGNPSQGYLEPSFMELLGSIPVTWDETKILDAKISDYIITARKKGDEWFIAGITDWTARDISIDFDFLDGGMYEAVLCKDGINADRYPSDYTITAFATKQNDLLQIHMAPGGGFMMRLKKK